MRRFLAAVVLAFVSSPLVAAIPQSERDALLAWFNAAGGTQWKHNDGWGGAAGTECSWYGVECTNAGDHVMSIDMYDNGVKALAIDKLVPLTELDKLSLGANQIAGTLANISTLKNLRIVDLRENQLSGAIPQEITQLTKLEVLGVGSNLLTGPLPSGLSKLTKLQILEGYGNEISGPLPTELAQLKDLIEINFNTGKLTGPIPPEYGTLTNLVYFQVSDNQLTGTIPPQLGSLTKLQYLDLGHNQITGSIPPELANLTELREIELSELGLTGEVPSWIFTAPNMTYVLLASNRFTGTIPATMAGMVNARYIDLSNNQLQGPIPDFAQLTQLQYLSLNDNNLSGTLPVSFGNLTNLIDARLERNDLSGTLPPLDKMKNLAVLLIGANHFTGQLPETLSGAQALEVFSVFGNRFDGPIPAALGNLPILAGLDLTYNQFSGEPPQSLRNLSRFNTGDLRVDYNMLSTNDASLRDFITAKQGSDWTLTQTVAPTNVRVSDVTDRSAVVSWDIIPYSNDEGGYEVVASTSPGGTPEAVAARAWKGGDSAIIRGLRASTKYYFSVRTYTEPHDYQQSTLRSSFTAAVSATTTAKVVGPPEVTVTARPRGLIELDGVMQNTDTFTVANVGDVATNVTLVPTDNFFSINPTSFSIAAGATQTVTVTGVPQPVGQYEAEVTAQGTGIAADFWVPVRLISMAAPTGDVSAEAVVSRVDFEGAPNSVANGIISFRNNGTATLRGAVQSDSQWLIAPVSLVVIEPGQTANIAVTIDRRERAPGEDGTEIGSLSLLYGDASSGAKLNRFLDANGGTNLGVSISVVSVVDTTHPTTTAGGPPPLAAGQLAFFTPALRVKRFGSDLATDVTIANAFGSRALDDLKLFFSNAANSSSAGSAVNSVLPSTSVTLANVVGSLFQSNAAGGVQLRTTHSQDLAMSARVVDVSRASGEMRGALPVFRSDRGASTGQSLALTGLRKSATTHSDIELQELIGGGATVTIQYLDANGSAVGASKSATLQPFGSVDLPDAVPTGAVSAIVTNDATSAGRIAATAVVTDSASGDVWSIADWRRYYDLGPVEPLRVPLARTVAGSHGRGRPVRRNGANATLSPRTATAISMFNSGTVKADGTLNYLATNGGSSSRYIELAPKQTLSVDDVATYFGRPVNDTGTITFVPDHGTPTMTARIWSSGDPALGTVGAAVPVTATEFGLRSGESHDFAGLEASEPAAIAAHTPSATRTALSLVETAGESAKVRVTLTFAGGRDLAAALYTKDFSLAANGMLLFDDITQTILGADRATKFGALHGVALRVQVVEGKGAITPIVEEFDSGNGDSDLVVP